MNVTIYAGIAGDRNDRGMAGAVSLGKRMAAELGSEPTILGSPAALVEGGWSVQLQAASPSLRVLSAAVAALMEAEERPILTMSRCAASLATLPHIGRRFPDAAIVWFDAHGDCNIPAKDCTSDLNYLGGMVITGAAGEWETGLGDGIDLANVILVGSRDLDPPEQERIDAGQIELVPVGPRLGERLRKVIRQRPVYVHLDCDVLDAGLLATEYQSGGGLSFDDLREAFRILAEHDVLGLEITEFEHFWPDGRLNRSDDLLASIRPVMNALAGARQSEG